VSDLGFNWKGITYNARNLTEGLFSEIFRLFVFALGEVKLYLFEGHLLFMQNCYNKAKEW
jgi:hypothetical protein